MTDETKEAQDKAIAQVLRILGEHFEVVQIMASVVDDEGGTALRTKGIGNYYARKGMVQEWQECALAEEIARQISGKDDGENWKVTK